MRSFLVLAAALFVSPLAHARDSIVTNDEVPAPEVAEPATRTKPRAVADVGSLAKNADIVAVGSVEAIGLDPTSRHPRIVGLFRVEEPVRGVRAGESFTVVWTAPFSGSAFLPQAGQRIVLFGEDGLDGLVRPAGNGTGVYHVIPGSAGDAAYRDLRVRGAGGVTLAGAEELLPLDRFVDALRDAS